MKTELLTVANYAKKIGKTSQWVYKLIKSGKIKGQIIDGVQFVEVENRTT